MYLIGTVSLTIYIHSGPGEREMTTIDTRGHESDITDYKAMADRIMACLPRMLHEMH